MLNNIRLSKNYQKKIRYYLDFLWELTKKELKVRYKKTSLGFLWAILNPILQMVVIGTVFSYFIKTPNYFIFLFSGLLPWQFLHNSVSSSVGSLINERNLLHRAKFPYETIPFSIVLANFLLFLSSLIILTIAYLLISQSFNIIHLFGLLLAIFWIVSLTASISLICSTLTVKKRDYKYITIALLTLWFYATPIVYPLSLVPEKLKTLYLINPLITPFEIFRIFFSNEQSVNLPIILSNLGITIIICILSLIIYRKNHHYFVDYV